MESETHNTQLWFGVGKEKQQIIDVSLIVCQLFVHFYLNLVWLIVMHLKNDCLTFDNQ